MSCRWLAALAFLLGWSLAWLVMIVFVKLNLRRLRRVAPSEPDTSAL